MGTPINVLTTDDPALSRDVIGAQASFAIVADEYATLQLAVEAAEASGMPLIIPAGAYVTTDGIMVSNAAPSFKGVSQATTGTVIYVTANDVPGVVFEGNTQYSDISGFKVTYANQQDRTNTPSGGLYIHEGMQFSDVCNIWVINAYYGVLATSGGGASTEFNNTINNIRVLDWWRSAFNFESGGSGSYHSNLYGSAIDRTSVWRMFECRDFGGEFYRLNLERTTIRDLVMDLTSAHNVSFDGLHLEEISMPARGDTGLDGNVNSVLIRSTGQGNTRIEKMTIDTSHFGGYIVDSLTRTGSTATATLNLMGFQQLTVSGHGIEVGDYCVLAGADTVTSNEYNSHFTVTGVTTDTVTFQVGGSPASPAQVNSDADCITLGLGTQAQYSIPLVYQSGNAGRFTIGDLHMRDIRVIAPTQSTRENLLRLYKSDPNLDAELWVENLEFNGQRFTGTNWREPAYIVGHKRETNVSTFYFSQPHGLNAGENLVVYDCTDSSFDGVYTPLTGVSRYAVSVSNPGADDDLVRETTARAIIGTYQIAGISVTDGLMKVTTTIDNNLYSTTVANGCGLQVSIRSEHAANQIENALILDVESPNTFVVRSHGSNSPYTTETDGYLMLMEGGLSVGALTEGSGGFLGGIVSVPDLDEYCAVLDYNASVAAGLTVSNTINTLNRGVPGRDVCEILGIEQQNGQLNYWGEVTATNTAKIYISNPTAGPINPGVVVVRFRIVTK